MSGELASSAIPAPQGLPVPLAAPRWRARTDTLAKSERRVHATGTHSNEGFDVIPADGIGQTLEQCRAGARVVTLVCCVVL